MAKEVFGVGGIYPQVASDNLPFVFLRIYPAATVSRSFTMFPYGLLPFVGSFFF